ncbi:MAG: hypothetical protein JWM98_2466, partial [Thermoleophilia bacterium]|nr:hypothetical protein [Thermoleophilia bacterium]
MKQGVARDGVAVRYADGVDHVWDEWEPTLRRCERLLSGHTWRAGFESEELASQLRRAQYRAHTSAEFAAGLVPPPSATDAHGLLLGSLASCRDTLGVLAVRADLDELDDDTAEIGLHAVDITRDAFRGARSTTALVHAWVAEDQVDPGWLHEPARRTWAWPVLLWLLVATCAVLFVVLVVEVAVISH